MTPMPPSLLFFIVVVSAVFARAQSQDPATNFGGTENRANLDWIQFQGTFLAGQYIQLSLIFYFILQAPLLVMFYLFTHDIILLLGWGDEHVAIIAQQYVRIYIWSEILDKVQEAIGNLLETKGHEINSTVMGVIHEAAVVVVIVILVLVGCPLTIQIVAWVCLAASVFSLVLSTGIAAKCRWSKPFEKGMCRSFTLNVRPDQVVRRFVVCHCRISPFPLLLYRTELQ